MFIASAAIGWDQRYANAIRLNGTDEALTRTATATSSGRNKFTWDVWIRRRETGRDDYIHTVDNAALGHRLYVNSSNQLVLFGTTVGPTTTCNVISSVTIAAEVWTHVHVDYDTTQSAANRVRYWFDGVEDTGKTVATAPAGTDINFAINTLVHSVGRDLNASGFFKGDIALFHWIDASVVGVSTFAATINGTYQAIEATGLTYDANGHFLDFADANDLGNDIDNGKDHSLVNVDSSNSIGDGPPTDY